jgi:hypothetical protein
VTDDEAPGDVCRLCDGAGVVLIAHGIVKLCAACKGDGELPRPSEV